ncbi:MAG TPA: ABC transporter ATP-binding protein [Frankiaceae bacterium]|nr:ABC transporter ATP-binding protein [Frankiaceae bacterium]
MSSVTYVAASRAYPGAASRAVDALDLHVSDGEFVTVVGPSGSGKSTALRMLAGLEPVDGGQVLLGADPVTDKPPKERDLAMVFQSYALYPHMSVADNIGFPLRMRGVSKAERRKRVREVAELLGLQNYLGRRPRQLSGGQQQRVAMGRALIRSPRAFLMDEPLSNLDAQLRAQTRASLAELQARLGITTIYVTHDQVEAMTLGHRVAVLREGRLQQFGAPQALYDEPCNAFVAGFLGSPPMNLVPAQVVPGGLLVAEQRLELPGHALPEGGSVLLGLRPEAGRLISPDEASASGLVGRVRVVEDHGSLGYVHLDLRSRPGTRELHVENSDALPPFIVRVEGRPVSRTGETVGIAIDLAAAHIFDIDSGAALGRLAR